MQGLPATPPLQSAGPRFWRLPLRWSARALRADLAQLQRLASSWQAHFNGGYHDGGWRGAALVSPSGRQDELLPGADATVRGRPTPLLAQCPALQVVLAALPGVLQSARLLSLAPGSVIREHRDDGLGLQAGLVRLHVPLLTNPDVEFYLDGERVPMAEGECWYLDLSLPHRVQNLGTTDRVHLVVDCGVNHLLRRLLPSAEEAEEQHRAWLASRDGQVRASSLTSAQRFEVFRRSVWADAALRARLAALDDPAELARAAVAQGVAQGLAFTAEDVMAAAQAGRRTWRQRHVGV